MVVKCITGQARPIVIRSLRLEGGHHPLQALFEGVSQARKS